MLHSKLTRSVCLVVMAFQLSAPAQEISQTIRGSVVDVQTHLPLYAATVAVYENSTLLGATISDSSGYFRIGNIPVGRATVVVSYMGYRQAVIPDVIVISTREVVLPVEMEESPLKIEEITVSAAGGKGNAMNKLAYVSARPFSVEETDRYAGSIGDPARMALNFAGVQGNDDSNNDLVIRGNSPLGVLWRMEGVNIPNPNHFGVSGSSGGAVSMLNNRTLSLSDFMTGAFPAEYGNSNAGVFDLRMRNGNNEIHEFSGQLGIVGAEIMAEGPISKSNKSSYLAAYRYSTLAILHAIGINPVEDSTAKYQDISFRLNFPTRNHGNISLFGIGGKSATEILASEETDPKDDKIYGAAAMDEHFRTGMVVVGANYTRTLGSSSLIRVTVSSSLEHQSNHLDKVYRHIADGVFKVDSMWYTYNGYHSNLSKHSVSLSWNRKLDKRHSLRAGIMNDLYIFDMVDSIYNEALLAYMPRLNHSGPAFLTQPYLQWRFKPSGKFDFTAGIHGQILTLEKHLSSAVEPRAGFSYNMNSKNTFGFGTGLHSQMMPTYIYFALLPDGKGGFVQSNAGLDFMRSYHNVFSWDYSVSQQMRLKLEAYYQYLYNIPVEASPSSYSVLDEGHDMERFFPDSLVNRGTGKNLGIEFTLERFFSNSYFLMFTGSLFDSKRTGSDGKTYDALYNGRYILNALGSKEFKWGGNRRSSFTVGGKLTLAGGKRYTPIDLEASDVAGEAVYVDALRNTEQFSPYFRADLKLNYRLNAAKATHEFGFDIINITDRDNILKQIYVPGGEPPRDEKYQFGITPIFYYRIDFRIGGS